MRVAARLCRLAGADEALIPQWAEEGRRRAEIRRMPPFSAPARRSRGGLPVKTDHPRAVSGAILMFRDAANVRWIRRPDGGLVEQQ